MTDSMAYSRDSRRYWRVGIWSFIVVATLLICFLFFSPSASKAASAGPTPCECSNPTVLPSVQQRIYNCTCGPRQCVVAFGNFGTAGAPVALSCN